MGVVDHQGVTETYYITNENIYGSLILYLLVFIYISQDPKYLSSGFASSGCIAILDLIIKRSSFGGERYSGFLP